MSRLKAFGLAVFGLVAVSQVVLADRWDGPGFAEATVLARGRDVYEVRFIGGHFGRIDVEGDHDTDLDVFVYDDRGRLVASDTDYTDTCEVSFWVPRTGMFRVHVVNHGFVYNCYTMITN